VPDTAALERELTADLEVIAERDPSAITPAEWQRAADAHTRSSPWAWPSGGAGFAEHRTSCRRWKRLNLAEFAAGARALAGRAETYPASPDAIMLRIMNGG
jgi:hypothetical protein